MKAERISFPLFMERFYTVITHPLCILAVGGILLFIVSLTGLPIGNDESNWSITAQMWADEGRLPYRDVITNKTPGIFVLNYATYTLFGNGIEAPRALALAAVLLTTLALYLLVRHIASRRAAAFAAWIFVLLSPLDLVDGGFAQTETFMNLFRIVSFAVLILGPRSVTLRSSILFWSGLSGLSFGLAVAFKQIAILDAIPLLLVIWLQTKSFRSFIPALGSFALGAFLATSASILPLLSSGATVAHYVEGAWKILFESGIIAESALGRFSGFVKNYFEANLFLVVIGIVSFLVIRGKTRISLVPPLVAWALTDFLIYNAQGQYFDHHHKVYLLSGSIMFGIMADHLLQRVRLTLTADADTVGAKERGEKILSGAIIAALFLFYVPFQPDYFHAVRNGLRDSHPDDYRAFGRELAGMTLPHEPIYVWGERVGPIYYHAHRFPPTRQYLESLLGREGALAELQSDLLRTPPRIIVVPEGGPEPEWLGTLVKEKYAFRAESNGFSIYEKTATQ